MRHSWLTQFGGGYVNQPVPYWTRCPELYGKYDDKNRPNNPRLSSMAYFLKCFPISRYAPAWNGLLRCASKVCVCANGGTSPTRSLGVLNLSLRNTLPSYLQYGKDKNNILHAQNSCGTRHRAITVEKCCPRKS